MKIFWTGACDLKSKKEQNTYAEILDSNIFAMFIKNDIIICSKMHEIFEIDQSENLKGMARFYFKKK